LTIYLDHQASTPILRCVQDEMLPFWAELHGNPHSSEHSTGWSANNAIESARARVAKLIGADSDEIVFTSGATEANNIALKGFGVATANRRRNRILVSSIEHKCVLESAAFVGSSRGYSVTEIPVDEKGSLDLDRLRVMLSEDVLLVSIALVNNEIGTIQNINEISKLAATLAQSSIPILRKLQVRFISQLTLIWQM